MLHHLIHVNYTTILLTIFMIIFLLSNTAFNKRITNYFLFSIICIVILLIADSIESWTETFTSPHVLRIWMSAIGYTFRPMILLGITLILVRSANINRKLLFLPAILNGVISFSALFTNVAFSYSDDNKFVRGPLGLTTYIVSACYLLVLMIITIRYMKERNRYESFILFCMIFFAVISIYLEVSFAFDGFINATLAVSIVFYYLFFNAQTFNRDVLTQAFNRRCFYVDAQYHFSRLKAVISIDLNDLKVLNDTYGHSSGDAALCTIVRTIKNVLPFGCTLYRTGGDEFMILCFKFEQEYLENLIIKLRHEIALTPYTCAMGLAILEKDETFDQVCARADAIMYEDKIKIKGTRPR